MENKIEQDVIHSLSNTGCDANAKVGCMKKNESLLEDLFGR